jgi:hypothetical protein
MLMCYSLDAKDLRKKAEAAQLNGKFVEAVDLYTKLIGNIYHTNDFFPFFFNLSLRD